MTIFKDVDDDFAKPIFGYVSVRGSKSWPRSVLQEDGFTSADIEQFHGTDENRKQARDRIDELKFRVIAESDLGFAVAGTKQQWDLFNEGQIKTFERMMYTRAGRIQNVTHFGIGPEATVRARDDVSGRIPEQDANSGIDLLAIERPRSPLSEFPTPIPPSVDRYYLRVPEDVAFLLHANEAHANGWDGNGVKVAMVDSGWYRHPFFDAHGYNVARPQTAVPGTDPEHDPHGHGTGESANLFAVAPGATLLPIRASNDNGHLVATLAGFMLAKASDAKIITCSWGGDYSYPNVPTLPHAVDRIMELEIRDAIAKGKVVIFSAGNGNFGVEAQIPGVISAGGVYSSPERQLQASHYASGYRSEWYRVDDDPDGPWMQVPTVCGLVGLPPRAAYIMLPVPDGSRLDMERAWAGRDDPPDGTTPFDGWALFSGTSAAAPQVAGAAAVLFQKDSEATPKEIADALCATATDVRAGSCHARFDFSADIGPDLATGHGLINVAAAVDQVPARPAREDKPRSETAPPQAPDRALLIRFLTLLATDDGFRTRLETEGKQALKDTEFEGAFAIREPVWLAPKVECQAVLDEISNDGAFGYSDPTEPLSAMHC
jgi:subtilisin family serine protease